MKSRTVHTRENKKSKQTTLSSITGVNPIHTHGFGVYCGRRKVWSVRVDETLLKQAKPVLKAKFGSECRGVETWLAGLVAVTKGEQLAGVYPSNTVEIGKLVIERNVRTRRKLVVEEETETKVVVTHSCAYCDRPASYELFLDTGNKPVCDVHFQAKKKRGLWGYRQIQI